MITIRNREILELSVFLINHKNIRWNMPANILVEIIVNLNYRIKDKQIFSI